MKCTFGSLGITWQPDCDNFVSFRLSPTLQLEIEQRGQPTPDNYITINTLHYIKLNHNIIYTITLYY